MSLTQIIGKVFVPRQHALEKHQNGGEALQRAVLEHLIQKAKDTEYGRNHAFDSIKGYDDYVGCVPVNTYEELKGDIDGDPLARPDKMVCEVVGYHQRQVEVHPRHSRRSS